MASVTQLAAGVRPLASSDALVLDGVTREFGALKAIDSVSFTVAAGERRAVLGANGAGKTTLFNVVTGDFPATAGRVWFFGEDVTDLPPYERIRRGLRRTYQSSLLFRELSVRTAIVDVQLLDPERGILLSGIMTAGGEPGHQCFLPM